MEVCPLEIEHVDKVVDMRRHLVLMEGAMPDELVTLNRNVENNFNPWGVGWSERDNWLKRRGVRGAGAQGRRRIRRAAVGGVRRQL